VTTRFTVLIPIVRLPLFLPNAIESVLAQTVSEFELFIVCDGTPPETIECAQEFARRDPRVTVFPFLKGQRHGEAHLHSVLTKASGTFVAYLEDDDLWFPNHLEELEELLQTVDFGNTIHVIVHSDGRVESLPCDLGEHDFRQRFLDEPFNRFGFSTCGHSLDAYRRLPEGWAPVPVRIHNDLHMWRKFLSMSEFKFGTRMVITAITLPSYIRDLMSPEERAHEAKVWLSRIHDKEGRANIVEAAWGSVVGKEIQGEQEIARIKSVYRKARTALDQMEAMNPGSLEKIGLAIEAQANAQLEVERLTAVLSLSQKSLSIMTARAEAHEAVIGAYRSDLANLNSTLENQIARQKDYQSLLEREITTLRQDSEKQEKEAEEQLSRQAIRAEEMQAQISDLETEVIRQAGIIGELRRQVTANQDELVRTIRKASLTVSPEQVPVGEIVGVTEITWDTGDGTEGQIYVSVDGDAELLFATGPSGSKPALWIEQSLTYQFRLYAGTEHEQLLGEAMVTGISTSLGDDKPAAVEPIREASLTVSPEQVPVGETVGVTEITWDTGDGTEGQVYVAVDGEAEALFATGPSGSKPALWIEQSLTYQFRLYAGTAHGRLLVEAMVTGISTSLGDNKPAAAVEPTREPSLTVSPEQVPVGIIVGITEITWDTGDGTDGQVYVAVDGAAEALLATGPSGSKIAPWIEESLTYQFRLYAGTEQRQLLGEALATGTSTSLRDNKPALRGVDDLTASKDMAGWLAEISLDRFLASHSTIEFPVTEKPEVSIILVLYNRAALTLQCLYSILRSNASAYEVVIIDNASTDKTSKLLGQVKGARIIQNARNLHFLRAVNQAAQQAKGDSLLLLNNDAQLLPGTLSSAQQTLNSAADIGAVGGKIILLDGVLQEAGSIIWNDGSCLGYGRGDNPLAPEYMYQRDVDYCSAAFLLTPRGLFLEGGGFDEDYSPAYYEETDYCVRLWQQGKRVVYDPNAIIVHYEFASSTSPRNAIDLQVKHRQVFAAKHQDWLQSQVPPDPRHVWLARSHQQNGQQRILFLDDAVPHAALGAGFPRSNRILSELVNLGHAITFYPTSCPHEDWADVYEDIPAGAEIMLDHGWDKLTEFLHRRAGYYDLIIISRPHNMALFKSLMSKKPGICGKARIIYDAEALFSSRKIKQSILEGQELSKAEQEKLIREEVGLAEICDCVVSVSDVESGKFVEYGCERVHTLSHSVEVVPTESDFTERRDILFVGRIHALNAPNADSMIWFSNEILPLIQERLGNEIKLKLVGLDCPGFKSLVNNSSVQLLGRVEDLTPLYEEARLFVAPTRFSAGIPLKVCEAAGYGLPVVATFLVGAQLGWHNEQELLLADDPQDFADACVRLYTSPALWNQLRNKALARVNQDFSPKAFREQLRQIVS
jgi:GT2 family glycosyltransferase